MPHIPGKPRPKSWTYSDPFDHSRHKPFLRSRSQAVYRQETWELSFQDWCDFWNTEELWRQRGRSRSSLCLVRIDNEQPWSRSNCCLLPRINQLIITGRRRTGQTYDDQFQEAIYP